MKNWLWLLFALVAMLAAASLAPLFLKDAGYVLLQFGGWNIETSVVVLLTGIVVIFLTLKLITWLLSLPSRAARNLAQRRLEQGLLALSEGDWRRAEDALSKSAEQSGLQRAGYLAAARAASGQLTDQDSGKRQQAYLEAADDGKAQTQFLVQLSQARLHMSKQEYRQAITILRPLRKRRRLHKQVLQMLATSYREMGDWSEFRQLLPTLRKTGLIDRQAEHDLQIMTACNELQSAGTVDALQHAWESLLRPQRQLHQIIASYARQAIVFGKPRLAEGVLVKALDKKRHSELLDIYADCHDGNLDKPLQRAEKWLENTTANPIENAAVERLLGRLCLKKQLWGKARTHLFNSINAQPEASTYELLGNLLQRQGELEIASLCYYNALQMAMDKPGQVQPLEPKTTTEANQLDGPEASLHNRLSATGNTQPDDDDEAIGDIANITVTLDVSERDNEKPETAV